MRPDIKQRRAGRTWGSSTGRQLRPEAYGTPAGPGTATIDLDQCGVGGVRHSGPAACVSGSALRANSDRGVYDHGFRMSAIYRLQWR